MSHIVEKICLVHRHSSGKIFTNIPSVVLCGVANRRTDRQTDRQTPEEHIPGAAIIAFSSWGFCCVYWGSTGYWRRISTRFVSAEKCSCFAFYLHHRGYVIPGICTSLSLSVCPLATSRENCWTDLCEKRSPQMYSQTTKKWFCKSSASEYPGLFEGFFNIARWDIFPQFVSYLWRKLIWSSRKMYRRCMFK